MEKYVFINHECTSVQSSSQPGIIGMEKQKGPGQSPKWVNEFFSSPDSSQECSTEPGDALMPASASRGDNNESVSGWHAREE
jgi:hypothetical protein